MSFVRLRRWWLTLGWVFVGVVVYCSLVPALPSVTQKVWDKASHLLSYAWLMLWFAQLHASLPRKARVALALVGLGATLELLQGVGGVRHGDMADGFANMLGVIAGLLISLTPLGAILHRLELRAGRVH